MPAVYQPLREANSANIT